MSKQEILSIINLITHTSDLFELEKVADELRYMRASSNMKLDEWRTLDNLVNLRWTMLLTLRELDEVRAHTLRAHVKISSLLSKPLETP